MASYTLFVAPGSCARVPTIALEEIGVPFETRLVRFMKGEHRSPAYLALNPKGKVPSLLIDGEALTENVAILRFLAHRHPEAHLLPRAESELDDARQIADLAFCSSTLHPIVTRIRMPGFFADGAEAERSVWNKAVAMMRLNFEVVEARLGAGVWWYGDVWSVMDAYLYWVWFRVTGAGFDPGPFPRFAEHARRMETRPAVRRALAHEADQEKTLAAEGLAFRPATPEASV
jgi:glutathione S-transferase